MTTDSYSRRHCGVGIIKTPKHPDPLELLTLQIEELLRILAAFQADVLRVHLQLFSTQLLVDFDFDRQTMAIPSGHVRRVESRHGSRLHDEVFQTLVQGVPEMDRTVGIRRPVVQDESRGAAACPRIGRKSSCRSTAPELSVRSGAGWPSWESPFSAD